MKKNKEKIIRNQIEYSKKNKDKFKIWIKTYNDKQKKKNKEKIV